MALTVIIDGYNLIRTTDLVRAEEAGGLAEGRTGLFQELAAYRRLKGHRIVVVFDGASPLRSEEFKEYGLKTIYTPAGQSADEPIISLVAAARGEAVVVTSDRALSEAVASLGGEAVASSQFRERLALAALTEMKGVEVDEERPLKSPKGPARRRPKKSRRRRAKLAKL